MSVKASVVLTLPDGMPLATRESVVKKVNETAWSAPSADFRDVLIVWEEFDLWSLRGLVERTVQSVTWAFGVAFPSRYEAVKGGSNTDLSLFGYWDSRE